MSICATVIRRTWTFVVTSALISGALMSGCTAVVIAAPGDLLFKLTAPDPEPGAAFGKVLAAVDGDILVSEPARLDIPIDAPGRAYLYDGATGQLKHTFNNPQITDQDVFAHALTGGDGQVFICTRGVTERIYAFSTATGELVRTIYEPEGKSINFGTGVAYGQGVLAVSSPSLTVNGMNAVGQGYLFDAGSGELVRTIPHPDPDGFEAFGSGISVAVFGDKVAFGTINDAASDGRVWVFDRQTGAVAYALENPNPDRIPGPPLNLSDWFGWSVAANEKIIVVSAQEDDPNDVDGAGSVYVFDSDTGALLRTLISPHLEVNGEFGRSVAVTGRGDVLVGAWRTSVNGVEGAGHVYLFDGKSGDLLLDIPNPAPDGFGVFGWSVAAIGDNIVIGAPASTVDGLPSSGAVYVYAGVPEPGAAVIALSAGLCWAGMYVLRKRTRIKRGLGGCVRSRGSHLR
jgi:FG-GAP repeat